MNYLIDTHVFIWLTTLDPALPVSLVERLSDPRHAVFLSAASVWEIAIKHQLGKLKLPKHPKQFIPSQLAYSSIEELSIKFEHVLQVGDLPPLHKDPFDRLLVCQAKAEKLVLVTQDPLIRQYDVRTVWD